MITSNVLNRVFFIKSATYGTAFTIDVQGRQYLVSARHVIGDSPPTSILFFYQDKWNDLPVRFVGATRGEADISVLATNIRLSPNFPMPADAVGIALGQDVYFVGYPYKMWTDMGKAMAGRPCPFVKKGILAAMDHSNHVQRLYIDAINNEGFSGGPVLFKPSINSDFQVAGVVSSFKTEHEPVIDSEGNATDMTVAYNTGFLLAYDIHHAIKIIDRNPIGLKLT